MDRPRLFGHPLSMRRTTLACVEVDSNKMFSLIDEDLLPSTVAGSFAEFICGLRPGGRDRLRP